MRFVNLTPHAINVVGIGEIPPSGEVARVEFTEREFMQQGGVPVIARKFKKVVNLPEAGFPGAPIYIVSSMVLDAMGRRANRGDVVAPDTGETAIRNERGQIVAVTRFVGVP